MTQTSSNEPDHIEESNLNIVDKLWRLKKGVEKEYKFHIPFNMLMNNGKYLQSVLKRGEQSSSSQLRNISASIQKFLTDRNITEINYDQIKSTPITKPAHAKKPRTNSEPMGQLTTTGQANRTTDTVWIPNKNTTETRTLNIQSKLAYGITTICLVLVCILTFVYWSNSGSNTNQPGTAIAAITPPTAPANSSSIPINQTPPISTNNTDPQIPNPTPVPLTETLYFSLAGSNTVGEKLAPALVGAWLQAKFKNDISLDTAQANQIQATTASELIKIPIEAHGSSTAFKSIKTKTADIGMASRRIKDTEVSELAKEYGNLTGHRNEHVIALDGLAIVVHPDNRAQAG